MDELTQNRLIENELISKLTSEEKFMLTAFHYSSDTKKDKTIMAYVKSRLTEPKSSEQSLYIQASRWLNLKPTQAFLGKLERMGAETHWKGLNDMGEGEVDVLRDKQQLESILNAEISKAQTLGDSRLLSDAIKNLNMLNQYQKDTSNVNKDKLIHFYLPQKCKKCPLYIEKEKQLKTDAKQRKSE